MNTPADEHDLPNAPAAVRNQAPLTDVLATLLPTRGPILEVASGTGQHAAHWAGRFPHLDWQPSDGDAAEIAGIEAWRRATGHPNLRAPLVLDVGDGAWPEQVQSTFVAVIAVNLLHISPWSTTETLLAGCARVLTADGALIVYGPFAENGILAPTSNVAFDASLKSRNPDWGIRDLKAVAAAADANGLVLKRQVAMPANNRVLVIKRTGGHGNT